MGKKKPGRRPGLQDHDLYPLPRSVSIHACGRSPGSWHRPI